MNNGKTSAALEWAKTWPHLDDFLKLNAILINEENDASLVPVPNSISDEEPFIDGTARHRRIFMFKIVLRWSDGYDPTNMDAEKLVTEWIDWVNSQYPYNMPNWPGADIEEIKALSDEPSIRINQDESVAEYNFQAKITYIE